MIKIILKYFIIKVKNLYKYFLLLIIITIISLILDYLFLIGN